VSSDPEHTEPFTEVSRIGWVLTSQRYQAERWAKGVRGEHEGE